MSERMDADETVEVLADVVHGMPVGGATTVRVTRSAEGYGVTVRAPVAGREAPSLAAGWTRAIADAQATAWPLPDVLARLATAGEHLLDHHNCDDEGHEEVRFAVEAARTMLATAQAPSTDTRSLAEIGREAAREAQRAALLGALEACGWNMSEAARRLRLGAARNTLRSIRLLNLVDEYRAAKAAGKITHDPRPRKVVASLTQLTGCASVAA